MRVFAYLGFGIVSTAVIVACGGSVSLGTIGGGGDGGGGDGGPATCPNEKCGPAPALAKMCPDGTTAAQECRLVGGACSWVFADCPAPKDGGADAADPCADKTLPACPHACTTFPMTTPCKDGDVCGNEIGDTCKCAGGKWGCSTHPPLGTGCNKVCDKNACFDDAGAVNSAYRACKTQADCTFVVVQSDCCGGTTATGVRTDSTNVVLACAKTRSAGFPPCACPAVIERDDNGKLPPSAGVKPSVDCVDVGGPTLECRTSY